MRCHLGSWRALSPRLNFPQAKRDARSPLWSNPCAQPVNVARPFPSTQPWRPLVPSVGAQSPRSSLVRAPAKLRARSVLTRPRCYVVAAPQYPGVRPVALLSHGLARPRRGVPCCEAPASPDCSHPWAPCTLSGGHGRAHGEPSSPEPCIPPWPACGQARPNAMPQPRRRGRKERGAGEGREEGERLTTATNGEASSDAGNDEGVGQLAWWG